MHDTIFSMGLHYLPLVLPDKTKLSNRDSYMLDLSFLPDGLTPKEYARTLWVNNGKMRTLSNPYNSTYKDISVYPKMSWRVLIDHTRKYQETNKWSSDGLDNVVLTLVQLGATHYKQYSAWVMDLEHWPCTCETTLAAWADSLLDGRYIRDKRIKKRSNDDNISGQLSEIGLCAQWLARSPHNSMGYPNVLSRCHSVWGRVYQRVIELDKEPVKLSDADEVNHYSFLCNRRNYHIEPGTCGAAEFYMAFGFAWAIRKRYKTSYTKLQLLYNTRHRYTSNVMLKSEFQDIEYRVFRWQQWRNQRSNFSTVQEGMSNEAMSYWFSSSFNSYNLQEAMMERIMHMTQQYPEDIEWVARSLLSDVLRSLQRFNGPEYSNSYITFARVIDLSKLVAPLSISKKTLLVNELLTAVSTLPPVYPNINILDTFTNNLLEAYRLTYRSLDGMAVPESKLFFIQWLSTFGSSYNEYFSLLEVLQPDYDILLELLQHYRPDSKSNHSLSDVIEVNDFI